MSKHTEPARFQKETPHLSPHLFLVRVWLEQTMRGAAHARMYGRLQHVATGQTDYFHDCSELTDAMSRMIPHVPVDRPSQAAGDDEHKDQLEP